MTRDNIKEYFNSVLESNKNASAETIDILRKLIDYTIKFRDETMAKTGEILTVGETRQAVDIYLEAVETERLRTDLEPKIEQLVKYWLSKINGVAF